MAANGGSRIHRALAASPVSGSLLALALAALFSFGVAGVGRTGPSNLDVNFFYAAGAAWRQGLNPYDLATFQRVSRSIPALEEVREGLGRGAPDVRGFSYPPNIAPYCMLLSSFPRGAAAILATVVNLCAVLAIAVFTLRMLRRDEESPPDGTTRWIVPALIAGNSFTAHVVWIGQTTLLATACLVAGWVYRGVPGRKLLAGLLLAASAVKPQVAAIPLLWLLLERDYRLWGAVGASSLLLVSVPLAQRGPGALARDWLHSLGAYTALGSVPGDVNSPGFQNMFGLRDLLVASGVEAPALAFGMLALFATAGLWVARRAFSDVELLGLILATSALFLYAHDYDLAMLAPFYAALWVSARRSNVGTVAVILALALLFFPQRVLRDRVPLGMLHWREIVLLAALAVFLALRSARPARDGTAKSLG